MGTVYVNLSHNWLFSRILTKSGILIYFIMYMPVFESCILPETRLFVCALCSWNTLNKVIYVLVLECFAVNWMFKLARCICPLKRKKMQKRIWACTLYVCAVQTKHSAQVLNFRDNVSVAWSGPVTNPLTVNFWS